MRTPDFENNLKKVLTKKVPARPTLFEFLISEEAEKVLSGYELKNDQEEEKIKRKILAFYNAGYDYVPFIPGDLWFPANEHRTAETYSLNEGGVISDRESFEKYPWKDMKEVNCSVLETARKYLPDGMTVLAYCPGGVLENAIALCGYENLCYMLMDDRELVKDIFSSIGNRLEKLIEHTLQYDCVGMTFVNDDWGFKNSTMISHDDLKELIYPHYTRIAKMTHDKGKVIGMHSCGNFTGIFEDLYEKIGFDGKHSYEDNIMPVEDAYSRYGDKIAVLGGIDMNFMCRADEEEIQKRCRKMLEMSEGRSGYALGSGNSVAPYMPLKNYFALLKTVNPDLKIDK